LPRVRCSRAANCSSSVRSPGRIRKLTDAFHMPMNGLLTYRRNNFVHNTFNECTHCVFCEHERFRFRARPLAIDRKSLTLNGARLVIAPRHTRDDATGSRAARETQSYCYSARRGFSNRLRRGKSRNLRGHKELRPRMEIDTFFCSHRCTSDVRLWLGARSVLAHQRVPLCHLAFFTLFDLLPCPSRKCSSLYCLILANPAAVQYRRREPATFSAIGSGTTPLFIHLRKVPR
jgi:hypothetical protein